MAVDLDFSTLDWDESLGPTAYQSRKLLREFLGRLNLKQEAPRQRSVFRGREIVRLMLPWVSIGAFRWSGGDPSAADKFVSLVAFIHDQPWKDVDDQIRVLRMMQHPHRLGLFPGYTCLGEEAAKKLETRELTPGQAFWMTSFENLAHLDDFRFSLATDFHLWLVRGPGIQSRLASVEEF